MLSDYPAFLNADAAWFAALVLATLAGGALERQAGRIFARARRRSYPAPVRLTAAPEPFDTAAQLRCVERAAFAPRRLLNRGEARLFGIVERACAAEAPDWRVMVQVSLGEILSSPDADAYRAINSKRVDLLIVGPNGQPLHAIEMQGSGHHLGPAATRDAIKKEALRRAGVGYCEIQPGDTPAEVRSLIAKLAGKRRLALTA